MAFTSGRSPKGQGFPRSWTDRAPGPDSVLDQPGGSAGRAAVGDATLTAVGLLCVVVVVLCGIAAKGDAGNRARSYDSEYTAGFGEGRHTVGEDVPPGTYVSNGARTPDGERCSVTTERADGGTARVRAADRGERVVVTLGRDDSAVTVRGCQDFALRELDRSMQRPSGAGRSRAG
ncbi:hypothetical protein [Streptomyces meridianus]|uniref:Uncharacterized protein n=1 Tax=Streptomyces meridianus TaxID=2938945 RepID=A0ABT0X922_9ACTN|nr:hypothetical protein [Streptomyces meridianus]MCM2579036.1 hypothetical protein [Streptomyces meridianus]